jgi:hypothetical protein
MTDKLYTVTITGPDGRKFEARGVDLHIEVEREAFEIRAVGLFESQDDMMRRLSAGPQTLRCSFELRVEENGAKVSE